MSNSAYENLQAQLKRGYWLSSISSLLGWDEQVNLPAGSADHRAGQRSFLAELRHQEMTQPKIGEWLAELEGRDLTEEEKTVAYWARRNYDRACKLPADFVREEAEHGSRAYHAWADCRKKSDFPGYAPVLQKTLDLAKKKASLLGWEKNPYDFHLDLHDPRMTAGRIEELFGALAPRLVDLAETILASPRKPDLTVFRGFEEVEQEKFIRLVIEKLGFNFDRGRIDRSLHPFCGGDGADTRMTTRFDRDNPLDALFSSIHETGHGLYGQGLPLEERHNALGWPVGMAVHESQSRLWENQVGRSRAFWTYFEPLFRQAFPSQLSAVSSEDLYLAINAVHRNPIRVDADEVTYNLHIMLRFALEKALFDGSLAVADLPGEWNRLSREMLGLDPKDDAQGVLQDIHWAYGSFGYFPSYCLGNMMAAQLWYTVLDRIPDLESRIAEGNFKPLLDWLRENIHRHGKRYDTDQIIQRATGQPLGPEPLLRYLRDRYLPLYR